MKLIFTLLSLVFTFEGMGQQIHFQHITSSNGLSQSEVYSFLEDSRGFMWFGTLYGLNRFDGYNMISYHTNRENPNSITNNTIRCLAEDHLGRVWIGTEEGLNVYDPVFERIHKINIEGFSNQTPVIHSIITKDNSLIISSSLGILMTQPNIHSLLEIGKSFRLIHYMEAYEKNISIVKKSSKGHIWVVSENSLFSLFITDPSEKPVIVDQIKDDRLRGVRDIAFDDLNNLWIATFSNGFFRYRAKEKLLDHFTKNIPNSSVLSGNTSAISSDSNGNLWIGTRDEGLLFLPKEKLYEENPKFQSIKNDPMDDRSLNSNLIYSLYLSNKRNLLWVGTVGSGINIYDPKQKEFNYYKIPPKMDDANTGSNFIRSVYISKNNFIWVGTHNNGLYRFDRYTKKFTKVGFDTHSVYHIEAIENNLLIICTSKGVSLAKINQDNSLTIFDSPIQTATFYAIKSKNNKIWVASLEGLFQVNLQNNNLSIERLITVSTEPGISINNCRVLCYDDEKNELYVGTEGGGLNILELDQNDEIKKISNYQKGNQSNSLSNNFIRSIILDSDKTLWLGTYEGLNKVIRDEKSNLSFQAFTTDNGLPNNMIQLLVEDKFGNIWIGTNKGLSKFNRQNQQTVHFSKSDGLQGNEFSEHAVYKAVDGEIIVGGTNGFNTFYPRDIIESNTIPNTTLTHFFISNKTVSINEESGLPKSITLTDSLILESNQNNIGFEFSSLIYSNPEKVSYSYKLEGFDPSWIITDANNRRVNYTNLDYGEYVFKVKSTNNDGLWEDTSKDIYIYIKTPFYLTWVAYVIYTILIAVILIYFANYSLIKYTTKKRILLENEHNQQLHALDELRTRFFINISHDLRTPLTLISSPLAMVLKETSLKEETRNRLQLINRNVQKLKYIVDQLLDIRKAEAGKLVFRPENGDLIYFIKIESSHFTDAIKSKGLQLHQISDLDKIYCRFDKDMISKIVFNLLSNAIKYTKSGEINIRIDLVSNLVSDKLKSSPYTNFIKLEIQDSGKGIPSEEIDKIFDRFYQGNSKHVSGYGIGLSHCKDLVEAHQGIIDVSSLENTGTTFRVFIPFLEPTIGEESEDQYSITMPPVNTNLAIFPKNGSNEEKSKKKILVIDDNQDMRNFIKEELKKEYTIIEAEDGHDGLEIVEKQAPDLIISDIMMPNIDGIEFCEKIKSEVKTSHIPLILLTAKGDTNTKYKSLELGADDYISKPFDIEYLSLRIKNLLHAKEQLRKTFQNTIELSPSSVAIVSTDKKFLRELMSEIEAGISDPDFTVNTLEAKMGMSHTNFYRKIKDLTGKSGKEILMDFRMQRAKQLISENTDVRISEVAYSVGFSNPKYFSKCFKEYYGVLPSDLSTK